MVDTFLTTYLKVVTYVTRRNQVMNFTFFLIVLHFLTKGKFSLTSVMLLDQSVLKMSKMYNTVNTKELKIFQDFVKELCPNFDALVIVCLMIITCTKV